MEIAVVGIGAVVSIVALVGCILPIVPGPPLAFLPVLLLFLVGGTALISPALLLALAVLVVGATVADHVLPPAAAHRAGAGRPGILGSVLGMIIGLVFFPPFGLVIGAFLGAFVGELLFHRQNRTPLRAALGVLRGSLLATLIKLATAAVTVFVFARGAIQLLW